MSIDMAERDDSLLFDLFDNGESEPTEFVLVMISRTWDFVRMAQHDGM